MSIIKNWKVILVLLPGAIIIMPAIVFTYRFYTVPFSNDIADWGAFGSYFGGVLGPVIALIGTLILGFISYQISKQSVDENRNLFLFEQRILAFQRVSFLQNEIEEQLNKMKIFNNLFKSKESNLSAAEILNGLLSSVSKIHTELKYFPVNFSHFFRYNFDSKEYKLLVRKSDEFVNSLYSLDNNDKTYSEDSENEDFMKELKTLIFQLKKEIETHK